MSEKRFELTMNGNEVAQYEIIDHNQKNLTIYNDLGNVYFSSAREVCELLNDLEDNNKQLRKENSNLRFEMSMYEQKIEDLEFKLRTIKAFDRVIKEEHSDSAYDFKKKLEKW